MANSTQSADGRYKFNPNGWPAERWAAVLVIGALGLLIALRMGFRGVSVMGASARIG
jgi:hypothetical protein